MLAGRIAQAGIAVVVQPGFIPAFGRELAIVPLPGGLRLMPFRTLRDAGVAMVLSSDFPAATLLPFETIAAAVTRLDGAGRAILREEALDVSTALDASTRGGAEVLHVAGGGVLEPGAPADLIWGDRDPLSAPLTALPGIGVRETWREGRPVFVRGGFPD
jgi:predicted amidohydrolase YtcJ